MNEKEVYAQNEKLWNSGIEASISKSPYHFTSEELDILEKELHHYAKQFGEPAILVEWGQPYGGPLRDRRYHPKAEIDELRQNYKEANIRGICPKAGSTYDLDWISEQRGRMKRLSEQPRKEFDLDAYFEFARNTQF